jgi:PAS domain S-box-containing protein
LTLYRAGRRGSFGIEFEVNLDVPKGPVTLLHVEDDANDAELIYRELRRAELDFTVTRVETEPAFRAALGGDSLPDVILADYRLPTFDGLTALRISREIAPTVPFIFVSGSLGEERAIEALREGATDYILKDRPGRLGAAVRRALREAEQRRARARAENAVAESEQRFRYAVRATRDVIWDHDLVAGTVFVNDAMRSTWGHQEESGDLAHWIERIHPEDREGVMASYTRFLESSEERWTCEFRFRRGDGTYGHVVERSLVLRDPAGRALRVIGAMQDTTEMRRMQEQIERAERVESLGRVAATIAHEFNNVLMGIQPIGEVIAQQHDPQISPLGRKIVESVARGRRVVDEILRMSRVPEPRMENFELAALLRDMRSELETVAGARVQVVIKDPDGPTFIRCDREHLQQVLINLTANARDAMPEGGRLTLSPATVDGKVVLAVRDRGTGIPAHVVDHIFEPLFTTKPSGTGLGLAVSHRLLAQNGASIAVDSTPGDGTTFCITFRRVAAEPLPKQVRPPRRSIEPLRVLMVEDNLSVAEGVRLLLETQGFETHVVERGGDVPDAVRSWIPDLVLLDLSLPDMSGLEVFDRLSADYPDLAIVLTSGHIDPEGVGKRLQRSNSAFLRKPYDLESLLKTMDRVTRAGETRDPRGPDLVSANG